MTDASPLRLGAHVVGTATHFAVFADRARRCSVHLFAADGSVQATELTPRGDGFFFAAIEGIGDGARYCFDVDGRTLTDPFARFLPDGVHGPARVVQSHSRWRFPQPERRKLSEQVIYELHVGTFTPEGTYAAAGAKLEYLADLGVTAVELMPLSAFQGGRGWGYDGVAHFAPFAPYGSPDDLRHFVDQAHGLGLLVLLDVVYNHFGPAGNYLGAFSRSYFSEEHHNAWGRAPNFGGAAMRRYVLENASYWLEEYRIDGFRFDATHALFDTSEPHILREVSERARAAGPEPLLMAEDERNDPACLTLFGVDALWADDFHHQLRVTLTGERDGYYAGYSAGVADLARTIEGGWLYQGQPLPTTGEPRGKPALGLACENFVYCIQNHDQIGNRALGTRLCHDVSLEAYCMASSILLFLPMTPLLFMGQEWAASTPFLYFTDHDPELGAQVTAGRRREFSGFAAFSDPERQQLIPDPQALATFERSKLRWDESCLEPHARVLALYRELLALRRTDPVLRLPCARAELSAESNRQVLIVRRRGPADQGDRVLLANFGNTDVLLSEASPESCKNGRVLFSSLPRASLNTLPAQGALVLAGSR